MPSGSNATAWPATAATTDTVTTISPAPPFDIALLAMFTARPETSSPATVDVADVHADADVEPFDGEVAADLGGDAQADPGRGEQREHAVTGGLDDRAAAAPDDRPHRRVVAIEHRLPVLVPE